MDAGLSVCVEGLSVCAEGSRRVECVEWSGRVECLYGRE